jgi:hypothetical protein
MSALQDGVCIARSARPIDLPALKFIVTVSMMMGLGLSASLVQAHLGATAGQAATSTARSAPIAWAAYKLHRRDPYKARYFLEQVQAAAPLGDLSAIFGELADPSTPVANKPHLLRILARSFVPAPASDVSQTRLNEQIVDELRRHARNGEPAVAQVAVLGLSRTVPPAEAIDHLREAHRKGLIDGETAVAELLIQFPALDQAGQDTLIAHVRALTERPDGRRAHERARWQLLDLLSSDQVVAGMTAATKAEIQAMFGREPPQLNVSAATFDAAAAHEYASWQYAQSRLEETSAAETASAMLSASLARQPPGHHVLAVVRSPWFQADLRAVPINTALLMEAKKRLDEGRIASPSGSDLETQFRDALASLSNISKR